MKTLRQVIQSVEPAGQVTTVRWLASLLDVQPDKYLPGNPISLNELLKEGSKYRRIALTPLTFMEHNLALFPDKIEIKLEVLGIGIGIKTIKLYEGTERGNVLQYIIRYLQASNDDRMLPSKKLDVVGFCEFWVAGERQFVYNEVANIFPYYLAGPGGGGPGLITEFDGGLMLLSRHPIVDFHKMIYRQCAGEDCLVSKGAIHARIEVSGHPTQYDIFLTHMQSCPPEESWIPSAGEGDSCWEKLHMYQLHALGEFITAHSSPDRPAILMGDLNHDGLDKTDHDFLQTWLRVPEDLWETTGDGSKGITSDAASPFKADRPLLPPTDPSRFKNGSRIDYFFSWPNWQIGTPAGGNVAPLYSKTRLRVLQSTYGKDISNHYGLETHLKCVRIFE